MESSDVRIKRKVTLRRKTVEADPAPAVEQPVPVSVQRPKSKAGLWGVMALLAVGVVGAAFYFLTPKEGSAAKTAQAVETAKEAANTAETVETAKEVENTAEAAEAIETAKKAETHPAEVAEAANALKSPVAETSAESGAVVSNDIQTEAMKVIRGDYGDGQERKNRLAAKYSTIQTRVNELKREGVF